MQFIYSVRYIAILCIMVAREISDRCVVQPTGEEERGKTFRKWTAVVGHVTLADVDPSQHDGCYVSCRAAVSYQRNSRKTARLIISRILDPYDKTFYVSNERKKSKRLSPLLPEVGICMFCRDRKPPINLRESCLKRLKWIESFLSRSKIPGKPSCNAASRFSCLFYRKTTGGNLRER